MVASAVASVPLKRNDANRPGLAGMVLALPWCCIAPGVLALSGVAGVGLARIVARHLMPLFLVGALLLVARAHYLLYVKGEGNRFSFVATWLSTLLIAASSVLRFWPL